MESSLTCYAETLRNDADIFSLFKFPREIKVILIPGSQLLE